MVTQRQAAFSLDETINFPLLLSLAHSRLIKCI